MGEALPAGYEFFREEGLAMGFLMEVASSTLDVVLGNPIGSYWVVGALVLSLECDAELLHAVLSSGSPRFPVRVGANHALVAIPS